MNHARLFNATVTLNKRTWSDNRGAKVPGVAPGNATTARASVQPMSTKRRAQFDRPIGEVAYTVYLAADPGLSADDTIEYQGRVLSVLAPAADQAGRGRIWAVDCEYRGKGS
ncbi:MAG: head-tail adaptor protein [Isosphaeraceae bacterium]